MYVFLEIFSSVKNCREHATNQRLHFSISWEGFGNGMNTFFPNCCNSLREFGHLSGYLESVLHSPRQQCFVLTILGSFLDYSSRFTNFFGFYCSSLIYFLCVQCNVCLSNAGCLMRRNLFLVIVRSAIVSVIFRLCSRFIPRILGVNLDRTTNLKAPAKMATIGKELAKRFSLTI